MKVTLISLITIISVLALALVANSCKEQPNEVIVPPNESQRWESIPEFALLSIRYMLQHNGTLYMSAVDPRVIRTIGHGDTLRFDGERGLIYKTTDGRTWTKVRGFDNEVGPMAMHGDTLYALCSDTIFKMLPNGDWQRAIRTPGRMADASMVGDIVFYKDSLYAMQSLTQALETGIIYPDGSYRELFVRFTPTRSYQYAGSKFLKVIKNGIETVFVRPRQGFTYLNGMFTFDGHLFHPLNEGLTDDERIYVPANSMALKNDTLYAGFLNPSGIKRLVNDRWEAFKDTLPNWEHAFNVRPNLITEPTAIAFAGERMFVATHCLGVLEWRDSTGWQAMSEGLLKGFIPGIDNTNLYTPVVFLEHFKGVLFAGYGQPAYAPWGNEVFGIYRYEVK